MTIKRICIFVCFILISPYNCFAISSLNDIATGATYRMNLSTGDVLEGVVDSKTDTSLILDCNGSAYTFTAVLISDYLLLAPPKQKKTITDVNNGNANTEVLTIDVVKQTRPIGDMFEITLTSGSVFRGKLVSMDEENLRLDVEGSVIPIAWPVISQIAKVATPKTQVKDTANNTPVVPLVCDTVIVKNPETDEYGKPKPEIMVIGKIVRDDRQGVTITQLNNQTVSYAFDQVLRIFRHTNEDPEAAKIKRYAMPLFCPQGMMLVDMPPGKPTRPFFKVCIDKYEYPNKENTVPQVKISITEAQKLCEQAGKRLCTVEEWQWSCSGMEANIYPYGKVFEKENCNTEGNKVLEPSGARNRCVSKFGAVDMTGNAFEWVRTVEGLAGAMGGPLSKCQTVAPGMNGEGKPTTGFRCCKSN